MKLIYDLLLIKFLFILCILIIIGVITFIPFPKTSKNSCMVVPTLNIILDNNQIIQSGYLGDYRGIIKTKKEELNLLCAVNVIRLTCEDIFNGTVSIWTYTDGSPNKLVFNKEIKIC